MGGLRPCPDKVGATMSEWLEDTIISIPFVEQFEGELEQKRPLWVSSRGRGTIVLGRQVSEGCGGSNPGSG